MTISEWEIARGQCCPICGRLFEEDDEVRVSDDLVETWGTNVAHPECLHNQERPKARPWV